MKKKLPAILAAMLLVSLSPAFAGGPDDMLETTTRIEMPGMSMPAQTARVCVPKGKASDSMLPQEGDCKMTDLKQSGNKTTFKMVCGKPEPMTGIGEFVADGPNAYRGKIHMSGRVEGQAMDMTTTYSSKRIGACTYEDPGKKAKEQVEATCRGWMEHMEWQFFIGKNAVEYCKPYRKEFCGHVAKLSDKMRDPTNYDAKNQNWKEAAEACGQPTEAVMKEACGRAGNSRNWAFVADHCPAEAKQISQQYCEGRSYTARMSSGYAPICNKHASAPTSYSKLPSGDAIKADGVSEVLEMGAKALKGLLNF